MEDKPKKSTKTAQLQKLEKDLEQAQTQYKRVLADYQNLERRSRDEKLEVIKFATRDLLEKLLPILDHLELAGKHLNDPGLNMVITQFKDTLSQESLEVIATDDQPFDPSTMDCVEVVPGPKDTVVKTLLTGYKLSGTVIRHAKVHVGDGSSNNN